MGAHSRNKGSAFEREVAQELFLQTGIRFARDLEQVRTAERGDLIADTAAWPFLIECKRRASGTACDPAWKQQADRAALAAGLMPCVIFRYDRQPTRVAVKLRHAMECLSRGRWSAEEEHWIECNLTGLAYMAREHMAGQV